MTDEYIEELRRAVEVICENCPYNDAEEHDCSICKVRALVD